MKITGTPEQWNDAYEKVMGMPRNGWKGFQTGEIKEGTLRDFRLERPAAATD